MATKPKAISLTTRLHDQARILDAAAAISDGRLGYVREYRKIAKLLREAASAIVDETAREVLK